MNSSSSAISSAKPDSALLVIKVSYGDTVRRFSVPKNAAQYLGMDDLRAKILDFFKFVHDADLIVSYIDEDQDVVTLVDDEDLRDAIRQQINPLRIKVSLNSKTAGSLDSGSSGTSTPVRSPHADSHPLSRSSGVSELLKSVPEPLREAVMKVSHDLASKAASSAPVVSVPEPLREVISKVSQDLTLKTATSSPLLAELLESFLKVAISGGGSVAQSSLNDHNGSKTSDRSVLAGDVYGNVKSEGVATSVSQTTVPQATAVGFDLNEGSSNSEPSAVNQSSTQLLTSISEKGKTVQKEYDSHSKNVPGYNPTLPYFPTPNTFSPSLPSYAPAQPGYSPTAPTYNGGYVFPVDNREKLPSGASFGSSLQNTTSVNGQKDQGLFRSFNSSMSFHDNNMGRIFHKGVRCDGCGVHPITGPRFKSKVKIDYDLCSVCFAEMGNENDYTRIDWPRSYRSARAFKDLQVPHLPRFRNSFMPHLRRCPMRPCEPKLDSHFIQDVNIADGTQMAPRTPFTKIWRMRNNGSITWPRGTRLVWIGGDLLTNAQSVELEMPAEGCLMENVLDIAVHFIAPELPGQYVSYWRMALPSGQKFGQCVWVIIQVDLDATQDASSEKLCNLNLNLPPKSSEAEGSKNSHHLIDMNAEPIDLNHSGFGSDSVMTVEIVKPIVDLPHPSKDAEIDATVNVGAAPKVPATVPCPAVNSFAPNKESALSSPLIAVNSSAPNKESAVSYPLIAVNSSEPYKESAVSYPLIDLTVSTENVDAVPISESLVAIGSPVNVPMFFEDLNNDNMVEQTLLKELEEMGFQEIDLNKEILRRNNYNFEQSVDELCGVSEWDPMLEDLDEMGFSDKETNKKLLIKNGGSIKRVVMDLIAGEKA